MSAELLGSLADPLRTSEALYLGLVALVALQRLAELRVARRNTRRALAAGGIERGRAHYPVMVALHASFLVAAPLEVLIFERPFLALVGLPMLALLALAALLRAFVVRTLGPRWTTRVIVVPGQPVESGGPFRYLRHPNYLAVVVELAALPLVHGAWLSAAAFTGANLLLLRHRVRVEERALEELASVKQSAAARAEGATP